MKTVFDGRRAVSQRNAAEGIERRFWRCFGVKHSKKSRERDCLACRGRRKVGWLTWEPGNDAPMPRVSAARVPHTDRSGYSDGQAGRDRRQPGLLVTDELRGSGSARQANGQPGSEAEHGVVPPGVDVSEFETSHVGMLLVQERADEFGIDGDLGRRRAGGH